MPGGVNRRYRVFPRCRASTARNRDGSRATVLILKHPAPLFLLGPTIPSSNAASTVSVSLEGRIDLSLAAARGHQAHSCHKFAEVKGYLEPVRDTSTRTPETPHPPRPASPQFLPRFLSRRSCHGRAGSCLRTSSAQPVRYDSTAVRVRYLSTAVPAAPVPLVVGTFTGYLIL